MQLFPIEVKTSATVTNLTKTDGLFTVEINYKQTFQAKTVIIATGKGAFEPRKMQGNNVNELVGQGVHYFVPNKHYFDQHDVAIAGGGDSAVDMATMLNELTHSTTLIHRRNQFRAMEQSVKLLDESSVVKETPKKVMNVTKQDDGKLKIILAQVKDETVVNEIIVDDLIINYGFISENKTVQSWAVQPGHNNQEFSVNQNLQTTVPGVFAIGDASFYDGKADLIAVGFGEAPTAVNAAIKFLILIVVGQGILVPLWLKIGN
ncbi:hypothetical protein GCM10025879_08990 [Leuconostoc litchii]|nr:hypothetical protein GCM10025879_08990 [Leuconostoc litchii]